MELLLLLIIGGAIWWGISAINATSNGISSANVRTFEIRMNDARIDETDDDSPILKEIKGVGMFPIKRAARTGCVTSVLDNTSGRPEFVISALEPLQEPESVVYQHQAEIGEISPLHGLRSWTRLGVVLPDILQPSYSGRRNLVAVFRMVDLDNPPPIIHGACFPHPGLLWEKTLPFTWVFSEKGYQEIMEHHDEARAISVKIGVAVALSDGNLDDTESETLKRWVLRSIEPFPEEKQQSLKKMYNEAMKSAYLDAENNTLTLSELTRRLNEIGDKKTKYDALELCFDVMSADGVADQEEIHVIRKVSEALGVDSDEFAKMRDQRIIKLDTNVQEHASIELLLGIESDWSEERIKKHLRDEFQKWNNRINTLAEGEERDNAQRMLDTIAEARKKYA